MRRRDQLNRRKLPVDGMGGAGIGVEDEEQAEANQGEKAERINPLAATATRSSEPASTSWSNTGATVAAILTADDSAA